MKLNYIIAITILLISGCDKKEKWKGASSHFKITRQESFNYSEMLSGELDSVKKSELEKFKDREILKNQKEESVSFKKRIQNVAKGTIGQLKQVYSLFFDKKKNKKHEKKIILE